ncbi:MAG: ThuA domain-containing protein [Pirellulales bacterium]
MSPEVVLSFQRVLAALLFALAGVHWGWADELDVLVLGGSGGSHRTRENVELVVAPLRAAGIAVEYTEDLAALTPDHLARRDALVIYKDNEDLSGDQEAALLGYVEAGGGLVAVHCASHCFRGSDAYTRLVGGRFLRHGGEAFRALIVDAQHPALRGVHSFESWDETYVHDQLGDDIRVLMTRLESGGYEPYAWVRRQGQGRVYYTALGHDHRTWRNPAFHTLLTAAVRWAAGRVPDDPPAIELTAGEAPQPLPPDESARYMHLPEGFRAELFAAEPDVVKPITMTFDDRGRLWVVESTDYPNNVLPEGQGNDRIKICEDTDGDGRADRFTVFAEGLNIPTSLCVNGDGVLVAMAPHIMLLGDSDGDDVADSREVVYTGLGRFDTHAVLSNIHYGLDNWYWAAVGYSGGEVTAGDQTHVFKQGLLRFRLDGQHFEVLTSTSNNTWGLGFDATGNVFASTANGEHSVHLAIPNRYFERARGWHGTGSAGIADHERFHNVSPDLRQVDHHGQYTAAAGHEIYNAAAYPSEYRRRVALTCEPTGHLVHMDFLVEPRRRFRGPRRLEPDGERRSLTERRSRRRLARTDRSG